MASERAARTIRDKYTVEFKQKAVQRLLMREVTLKQLAEELGVSRVSLIKWRQQHERQAAGRQTAPEKTPSGDDNELVRLRLEVAALREERDRLCRSIACLVGVVKA